MRAVLFAAILALWLHVTSGAGRPVVKTKYGYVEGKTISLHTGKKVTRFHGVPFAKPPVGDLRFRAPQEPEPWSGIRKANSLNAACPQGEAGVIWITHPGWSKYSEDCLYLNIFSPNQSSETPYPVMVWFHGGGYVSSANVQYPGHFLAGHDVVVVVPNYRIGALGFMSTGDAAGPGNWGMLDQVRALHFVQDNIAAFGGDPGRVTLFGQSAGAASSGLISLSPLARGLFHQVITESGSDQAIWAVNAPGSKPETFTQFVAAKLGCPNEDSYEMMDCLRNSSTKDLVNTGFPCTPGYFCQGFAPVADGEGGFLPEDPWTLREKGLFAKVPLLSGQCTEDGSLYTVFLIPESLNRGFNRTEFEDILRNRLIGMFSANFPDEADDVFEALNWYYSPWPYVDDLDENRGAFNELITDFGFGATGDVQIKSQSKENVVYYYLMGYRSKKAAAVVPEWLGVPHNGELPYVLGWPLFQKNPSVRLDSGILIDLIQWDDVDIEWANFYLQMWTNFAKTGNPTSTPLKTPGNMPDLTWKNFTAADQNYLYLSRDKIEMRKNYHQRESHLWLDYMKYVAGVDFIRPHEQLATNKARSLQHPMDSKTIENNMADFYRSLAERRLVPTNV